MKTHTTMLADSGILAGPGLVQAQPTPATPQPQRPAPMPPATVPAPQAGTPQASVPAPAAEARRASRIIGANVVNEQNRTIGSVDDLMLSPTGGPVTAVLSVGGFLGIGEQYVTVPISELRWSTEHGRWMLPGATAESLKARPAFTYPDADRR